ncbi:MAG: carbon storage regulator CsrA [Desulfovibrionales bacterium]
MLVLTRRPGESIQLGDDITITVLSVKGKQIKLGIDVPEKLPVYREEVFRKVQEQNRMAIRSSQQDLLQLTKIWKTDSKPSTRE